MRFMHEVLRGLPFCFVYLDDILCYSENAEEHRSPLRTIFQRLSSYGLKLNISKCVFGVTELIFLGHLITPDGGALHQVVDSELQPLAFFSRKLTSSEKSYSAYDRELLAIYSAIRHFRQKSDKCSPRQIRQLDFISQFTTNIVHIPGSDNIAADVLSRVSAITFPSQIDYDCIAETQQTDQELHTLIASGTSLNSKKVKLFPIRLLKLCVIYQRAQPDLYIPKQHRQDVFSAMHNLSHPGIRRSVHLMKQRFVWPSISSDVAKWARHCLACQKSKKFIVILDHLFHHFKNLPNVLIMFIWISLDLYLHQMATPID
ncbi:gag-pol polyprotein [Trichonephila clavipes]|nr:gag-pol polyprotein [Trichonephila clavipes]